MATLSQLAVELSLIDRGFASGLDRAAGKASAFGGKMKAAIAATALVGAGAVVGKVLYGIGDSYDAMSDQIQIATGKSGAQLKALDDTAVNVFKTVPTTMATAGDAIAALAPRTDATGKTLERLTASEIELARITGTDLKGNIEESTKIFNAWGVGAKDQTRVLDGLFSVSQKTGVGIDRLMQEVEQFTPVTKQLGLNVDQSANLIGKIDKAGGHATLIMRGLNKESVALAKAGIPVKKGMTDVYNAVLHATSAEEAATIASKAFGAKAGPELAQMIRAGTLSLDDFTGSVDKSGQSILDTAKSTYDFSENWTLFKNNIEAALIPVGSFVFSLGNKLLPALTGVASVLGDLGGAFGAAFGTGTKVSDLVKQFPDWLQPAAKALLLVADAAGDVARGFSVDGLSGAFSALGPAIQQSLNALRGFAITVTVDIANWAIGKVFHPLGDWLDTVFGGSGANNNPEMRGLDTGRPSQRMVGRGGQHRWRGRARR